jgi:signal transduction histidine kinase
MIDQVFNIEKAEAGSIEIDTKTFDLKDLVNNIVSDVQASMDEYDNTLQVNYTASPEKVISDAAKIKQILVNLINHANKFSRKSLVEFNVSLSTTEGATWMRFQISNEGLGMTPAQIERFTQAKDLDTLQYDDIGLMVSQRFCQLLGGELVIESTVDKSTTFTIDLPVRIPNA